MTGQHLPKPLPKGNHYRVERNQSVAQPERAHRVHQPPRQRLALPGVRAGQRAEPLPRVHSGARRREAALRLRPDLAAARLPQRGHLGRSVIDNEHQAIVDPDNDIAFDYPTNDYQIHNYRQWLLENVASILDADLGISSAGLLRRRAQAWVEISVPENIETPEGVVFRPNLLAWTSLDRTLSTTYKRTIGEVVCDNTLSARIGEEGETYRIRHTANSLGKISEARQALNIIYSAADDFSAQVHDLCRIEVTEKQWQSVLAALVPTADKEPGRSLTIAENKKGKLNQLYHFDPRCAPWAGTKWGVIQTANTFNLHEATVRNTHGGGRAERNQLKIISGQADRVDHYVSQVVDEVLASA
jgi:phage/plasmid-like protein (TIGR03299 family)